MTTLRAIQRHLEESDLSRATIDTVSRDFGVSPTTLRRRLTEDGTTFHTLKDLERLRRLSLLNPAAPAKQIAEITGHSDKNSVYRWYKTLTGQYWRDRWPNGRKLDLNFSHDNA